MINRWSIYFVVLLQTGKGLHGNLDDVQTLHEDVSKRTAMQGEPVTRSEAEDHKRTKKVETERKPVKRTSKRLQSKMPSQQARFI